MINLNISQVQKYYSFLKKKAIEQTKLTYSPLGKALEKETKTIEDQGKLKFWFAVTNQNKTLVALTNKDDHKDNYKKINWKNS